MKYIYKVVSLDDYLKGVINNESYKNGFGKASGLGVSSFLKDSKTAMGKVSSKIWEDMLNEFAKNEWEYWQTIDFSHSSLDVVGEGISGQVMEFAKGVVGQTPLRSASQLIIFRKLTDTQQTSTDISVTTYTNSEPPSSNSVNEDLSNHLNDEALLYGITFNGEKYCYKEYKYDKLVDAISYAKRNSSK